MVAVTVDAVDIMKREENAGNNVMYICACVGVKGKGYGTFGGGNVRGVEISR